VTITKNILDTVEEYVSQFYNEKIAEEYVYHDITHTQDVVRVCRQLGISYGLSLEDIEILELAAWFHDTGYDNGPANHEERSAEYAEQFLGTLGYPDAKIARIIATIKSTKLPVKPTNLLQQIICDADLSHLGEKNYWIRTAKVREELMVIQHKVMNEEEWIDFELSFMMAHQYNTPIARDLFEQRKMKHILQLRKQKMRLNPNYRISTDDIQVLDREEAEAMKWKAIAKQQKQELKNYGLGRGVETMYRTTYNTHNNLSALADHKANLMLSINTIMISITVSVLVPKLESSPYLIMPTVVLLLVCLTSIIFATLSTRPKVTKGEVTKEDIEQKRSNLLFFGNFFNMKLEDFQWGMMEMIKDPDFQYNSMTRDLYFLGKVLSKKYRYLTYCYNIFMFGLILVVILFAYMFITTGKIPTKGS
jgi:predicted metal-dependent HD superfamily phosphohydrolase